MGVAMRAVSRGSMEWGCTQQRVIAGNAHATCYSVSLFKGVAHAH